MNSSGRRVSADKGHLMVLNPSLDKEFQSTKYKLQARTQFYSNGSFSSIELKTIEKDYPVYENNHSAEKDETERELVVEVTYHFGEPADRDLQKKLSAKEILFYLESQIQSTDYSNISVMTKYSGQTNMAVSHHTGDSTTYRRYVIGLNVWIINADSIPDLYQHLRRHFTSAVSQSLTLPQVPQPTSSST